MPSLGPDAPVEQRAAVRDELIRTIGESKKVIDLESPVAAEAADNDGEVAFRAGDFGSRFSAAGAAALDVRDKGELAALRGARKRDRLLWRVAFGCAAALVFLAVGEIALIGGRKWNDTRLRKVAAQKPTVDKIVSSQSLATSIEDLRTKRMLPFEMISILVEAGQLPLDDIQFTRVQMAQLTGIYTLTVTAKSSKVGQISHYEARLRSLPMVQKADATVGETRGESADFTLVVTFKPDTVKPADSIAQ